MESKGFLARLRSWRWDFWLRTLLLILPLSGTFAGKETGVGRFLAVGVALLDNSFCQRPSGRPDTLLLHEEESAGGNKLINENMGCRPSEETLMTHIIKCITHTHTHSAKKGAVFNQS